MRVNGRTFYAILKDAQTHDIVIWGDTNKEAVFLKNKLALVGVTARAIIAAPDTSLPESDEDLSITLEGLVSLAQIRPLIVVLLHDDYNEPCRVLTQLGLRAGWDFRWIKRYGHDNLQVSYLFDPILGFNTISNDSRYQGFRVIGDPDDSDALRIVVLGGSSSDPDVFHFTSWPEFLHNKLSSSGVNPVLFNGATTGFTCSQEMVKLLRDVMAIRPDVVISFSGINNNHLVNKHPFFLDYNLKIAKYFETHDPPTINIRPVLPFDCIGYQKNQFDRYTFWLNQEKTMKYFCDLHNVAFYGFLQPNLMSKDKEKLLPEESEYLLNRSFMGRFGLTPDEYSQITGGFRTLLGNEASNDWLYDLSDIFDGDKTSVYIDAIHVDENGNEKTAQAVFERIYPECAKRTQK